MIAEAEPPPKKHPLSLVGSHSALWHGTLPEVILEGPAGTGKSRTCAELVHRYCSKYPAIRCLVLRKTRKSLVDAFQSIYEEEVVWPGHPAITPEMNRLARREYLYPVMPGFDIASKIVLGGVGDKAQRERLFSTQFDVIYVQECTELTLDDWERLKRALRNNKIPHPEGWWPNGWITRDSLLERGIEEARADRVLEGQDRVYYPLMDVGVLRRELHELVTPQGFLQFPDGTPLFMIRLIGDCNPDAAFHWANQRMLRVPEGRTKPLCKRLTTLHRDNPSVTVDYLAGLESLTGVLRDRLYLGKWVTAEGLVWPQWDPHVHMVEQVPMKENGDPALLWWWGGQDWGHNAPAASGLFGMAENGDVYLVEQFYKTGQLPEDIAKVWIRWDKLYDLKVVVCDPEDPAAITVCNKRMIDAGRRSKCIGANMVMKPKAAGTKKTKPTGLQIVRERLRLRGPSRKPRFFVVADSLYQGRDKELDYRSRPCSFEEEVSAYCFAEQLEGHEKDEETDKGCADHACDMVRYALAFADWQKFVKPRQPQVKDQRGTLGHFLEHEKTWEEIRKGKWL